jgi:hypothetical protein
MATNQKGVKTFLTKTAGPPAQTKKQRSNKMDMEKIFNNLQTRKHDKKFAERLRANRNILTK